MTAYSPLEWIFARLKLCLGLCPCNYGSTCSSTSFTGLQAKDFIQMKSVSSLRLFQYLSCFSSSELALGYFIVLPLMFKYILLLLRRYGYSTAFSPGYPLCCDYNPGRFWNCLPASPTGGLCSKNGACKVPDPQKTADTYLQCNFGVFSFPFA